MLDMGHAKQLSIGHVSKEGGGSSHNMAQHKYYTKIVL
jgi:hypothetical protein